MEFGSVYHKPIDNLCYAKNEDELVINVKTGHDVKEVYLLFEDPFKFGIMGGSETWSGNRHKILHCRRLSHHLFWSITVNPKYKRCKYFFELRTQNETWFYSEHGFESEDQVKNVTRSQQYFVFPWMNSSDISKVPSWAADTVWYQIFPDRFHNGNPSIDPPDVCPWQTSYVTNEQRYGGDIAGITQKLDYLADLGISGIYLTPINKAWTTHKYDTIDYETIDPHFGDKESVKEMVKKAHERGIRIMFDAVFNHSGPFFEPWQDVLSKKQESKYANWFMINNWDFKQSKDAVSNADYFSFAFVPMMPKLNTNHEEVISYFQKVCCDWIRDYDIDGIRFDVGNEVSHHFLKQIRLATKRLKPDVYLIGETWHESTAWMRGDEYDSIMNYPLKMSVFDFWRDPDMTAFDFETSINRCYSMYMEQFNDVLFNLFDSHDTDRLINSTKNKDIFYQQMVILFTMAGSPCIYYGTEIIMEGGFDPDCRRCMPWEDIESGKYTRELNHMKNLIQIRKEYSACKSQHIEFDHDQFGSRVISYTKRGTDGSLIQVILNASDDDILIPCKDDILFSNGYQRDCLQKNGSLIIKTSIQI